MRSTLPIVLLFITLLGCSKSKPENELLPIQDIPLVEVCARVNSIGHFFPLPGTSGHLRWFVDLTITSALKNVEKSAPQKGENFQFFIHSPSRDFGDTPKDSQDKIFLIKLLRLDNNWTLMRAQKSKDLCPN